MNSHRRYAVVALFALGIASIAAAQGRPDPIALMAARRKAMKRFAFMDGVWRGPAWPLLPSGAKHEVTQTERMGPMLDGSIKVIEGKGYEAEGRPSFNAFATISYDGGEKAYRFSSHAMGMAGDFVITPAVDSYAWEIPAGPQTTIRYTAVVKGGEYYEFGDRIVASQPPLRSFEMRLKRIGDTRWPAGDAVAPN